jgi:hypothetical protein
MCAINVGISIWNANSVGKIWTEAKYIGGGIRVLAVCGYIMSVAGFTMVYSIIIMVVVAATNGFGYFDADQAAVLLQFVGDLSYILIALAVIPTGILITINSLVTFWKNKNIRTGAIGAWNTFATVSNVVSAARSMPSAFGRILEAGRRNRDSGVIFLGIIIVALCVLGGYFTASAIVKRADRKYDLFENVAPGYANAGGGMAQGQGQSYAGAQASGQLHEYRQAQGQGEYPHPSGRSMAEREAELRRKQGMS